MPSFRLLNLVALVVLATPAYAQAPPCDGTYEYFSGKNFVEALPGNTLPKAKRVEQAYNNREGWVGQVIRKPQSEGLFNVEVGQCGRQFVISQGGKQMLFLQSGTDEALYIAQDIGTEEATKTMRVVGHKVMIGKIEGDSHGFKYTFPVAMEPRDISMPDMEGCAADDDRAEPAEFALENAAARAFLANRGMTPPPGFAPDDFFRTIDTEHDVASASRKGSIRHIRFLLGRGNAVLPETGLREICRAGANRLDPPRRMLNFKIFPMENPDGYLVFAQEIDIETGKILVQAEGESDGRGAIAVQEGMAQAAQGLESRGTRLGPLSDGIVR